MHIFNIVIDEQIGNELIKMLDTVLMSHGELAQFILQNKTFLKNKVT